MDDEDSANVVVVVGALFASERFCVTATADVSKMPAADENDDVCEVLDDEIDVTDAFAASVDDAIAVGDVERVEVVVASAAFCVTFADDVSKIADVSVGDDDDSNSYEVRVAVAADDG